VSSSRVLPPKSLSTQSTLERERSELSRAIRTRCMNDYGCHDMPLAKDLLRSHTCSIFDTLKSFYSNKISIWEWEQEIAEEAIQIVFACWKNFRDLPVGDFSSDDLRRDIALYIGRPLRSGPLRIPVPVPPVSESPLLTMAKAAARGAQQKAVPSVAAKLKVLKRRSRLSAQKIADGISVDLRTVQRHLSGTVFPRDAQILAYEKFFTNYFGEPTKIE
jgi:hypothetical protein